VKSGDYGHRSLARMIKATIEEEYPKRGASNWLRLPSVIPRQSPLKRVFRNRFVARHLGYAEQPTELPLPSNAPSAVGSTRRYPMMRRAWRLLPEPFRHRVMLALPPVIAQISRRYH
jgi:hypothetical protein